MNSPSRAPAGTPTGGQFAPGQHAETGVAVADPVQSRSPDTAAVDAFLAEGDAISQLRDQAYQRQRALSEQAAALVTQAVRARYPDAARVDFILWEGEGDDGDDAVEFVAVRDANGEVLCDSTGEDEMDLPGSSGPASFGALATTVRPYVHRAHRDSPDGFSLDVGASDPAQRVFQDPVSGSYHRSDGGSGYTCPECGNGYASAETADPGNHDCEGTQ